MADATLIAAIRRAASQTGADPVLMVATSLVESGATWYPKPGDNGTSFGPFQFHIGGALGSNPPAWASTYAAIVNRAQVFVGAKTPADAARIQGADNTGGKYQNAVAAQIPTARALLSQVPAGTATVPGGTAPSSGALPSPGQAAAGFASTQLGVPYSWAGGTLAGPSKGSGSGAGTVGFDCSGLVLWAYGQLGIALPHYTGAQYALGVPVAKQDLRPGDALFFRPDASGVPQHEGLYVGGGKFVEAAQTGTPVRTAALADRADYIGARRYVADATVNRSGSLVAATPGRLAPADATALKSNWGTAVQKLIHSGGGLPFGIDIPTPADVVKGAAGDASGAASSAVGAALGPVGDAITGATSSVEHFVTDNVAHAFVWLMLAGLGVGLIVLGTKRAAAPNWHPVQDAKAAAAKAAESGAV